MDTFSWLVGSQAATAILAGVIVWFIKGYLDDSGWKKIIKLQLQVIEAALEKLNVDIPEFLQKIIDGLHASDEDTAELEKIYQDEKLRITRENLIQRQENSKK